MPLEFNDEPIARGVIVPVAVAHAESLAVIGREMSAILRALKAEVRVGASVPADADFVVLLTEGEAPVEGVELPEFKDRVGSAIAFAETESEGRVANVRARKHLRSVGATLGPRQMAFYPKDLGYLGIESDGLRERLEELLQTLVLDAERLRLKREGWEEPDADEDGSA